MMPSCPAASGAWWPTSAATTHAPPRMPPTTTWCASCSSRTCCWWRPAAAPSPAASSDSCWERPPWHGPARVGDDGVVGVKNPVEVRQEVPELLSKGWEAKVGGKIEFVVEPQEMVRRALEHIDKKRAALGLA